VPDKRTHRGRHPDDDRLFAEPVWPVLREAVGDLSWLLTRGYAEKSSLKLVGDRFSLAERQRNAVMRCACSDQAVELRKTRQVTEAALAGASLLLDGYNVLTTVEVALARGVVIEGRDGCYRDMASMHGTFRKVEETLPAVKLLGQVLEGLQVARCLWYLDSPVSNSGRLKSEILRLAADAGWNWEVNLVTNPDAVLARSDEVVATSDSVVLDRCRRWFNLARAVVARAPAQVPVAVLAPISR
jgi:hypothetical protein